MAPNQALKIPYVELRYVIKMAERALLSSFGFSAVTVSAFTTYKRLRSVCQVVPATRACFVSLAPFAFTTYNRTATVCQVAFLSPSAPNRSADSLLISGAPQNVKCRFACRRPPSADCLLIAKIYFHASPFFGPFGIDCATCAG